MENNHHFLVAMLKFKGIHLLCLPQISGETIDGRNSSPPGMYKIPVNKGINYQPQLVIAGFLPSTAWPGISFLVGQKKWGKLRILRCVAAVAGHRSSNAMHVILRVRWSIVIHHQRDLQMQRICWVKLGGLTEMCLETWG